MRPSKSASFHDREGPPGKSAPRTFAGLGARETDNDDKMVGRDHAGVNPATARLWFAAMRAVVLGRVSLTEIFDNGARFTVSLANERAGESHR